MLSYWFEYDTNGKITPYLGDFNFNTVTTFIGPYPQDTAPVAVVMAYNFPTRYLVQNGQLVGQPYFTLAAAQTQNEYAITATLANPPATPPASATFEVAGATLTEPITNNQAVLTLGVHPAVAQEMIALAVSATGCAGAQVQIGGSGQNIGLQVYTPTGGVPIVAPGGPGSLVFLSDYYYGAIEQTEGLLSMGIGVTLLMDVVFNVLLPAAQAGTRVTLDANQASALADFQASVLPNLVVTMENIAPSGGQPSQFVGIMGQVFAAAKASIAQYGQDAAGIPNLQ